MSRSAMILICGLFFFTGMPGQVADDYFRGADTKLVKKYNEAISLLKSENAAKGIKDLTKLSDKNPGFYEAHIAVGFQLKEKGMFDEAIPFFSRAIKVRPESALAYFYRGDCFLMLKKYAQAGGDYGLCIRYDSLFYAAYNNLAVVHILNQGKGKLLESELRLAKEKIKELEKRQEIMDPVMLMNTGLIHLNLFEFRAAIPYFDRYLSLSDSLNGAARYDKALCHYYLKEYEQAKKNFLVARASGYRTKDCTEFISFLGYIEEQLRQSKRE
jgi:tetratricopeptide (TPR) repeat protein